MNPATNALAAPKTPVADRNSASPNTNCDDDPSQVRFADVLRGKQGKAAEPAKAANDPAGDDTGSGKSTPAPGEGLDAPGAAATLPADGSIAGLIIDPARILPSRTGLPGGASAADGALRGLKSAVTGTGDTRPAVPSLTSEKMLAPSLSPALQMPVATAPPVAQAMPAFAAAVGLRADAHPTAGALAATLQATLGEALGARTALSSSPGTETPLSTPTPAGEAGRIDPAAWAAFAVPVDSAAARQSAPVALPAIEARVGTPRFADETAQQVTWMVKNGVSEAEIRVKPAELGPISVRIEMNQNEAMISFAVTQPETRAAVQDSLHRLTEMLAESGISLGEASVGGQDFTQQSRDGGAAGRSRLTFNGGRGTGTVDAVATARMPFERARGLVDTFA
jgi:flagellar hook-length control protein FliK